MASYASRMKGCYPPATTINTLGAIPIHNKSDRNGERQFTKRDGC